MKKRAVNAIILSSLIAAMYAALTYFGAIFGLSYGAIQIRFSEIMTILPIFTPYAVPGLAVGCFLGNLASSNPFDIVVGTLATLLSAYLTRKLAGIKLLDIPVLSLLCPVIINALAVGAELSIFLLGGFTPLGFIITASEVALGEFIVVVIMGIPFYKILLKYKERLFK